MTIKELQEKKDKLDGDIAELVVSFQEETEVQIISIEVHKRDFQLSGEDIVITGIKSNIEL